MLLHKTDNCKFIFFNFMFLLFLSSFIYSKETEIFPSITQNIAYNIAQYSKNGQYILCGAPDKTIKMWDVTNGTLYNSFGQDLTLTWFSTLKYNKDNSLVMATTFESSGLHIYDTEAGDEKYRLFKDNRVNTAAFSSDGNYVAALLSDTIVIWDFRKEAEILSIIIEEIGSLDDLILDNNCENVILRVGEKIKVFNINTGKEEKSIYVDDFMLNPSMALSPDGSRMITASGFNVKIWDTQKWREVRTLQGPGYALSSIAYSFDGSLIAAGSYIKAIRIWDSKGNELKTFTVPNNPFSISFSPDNKNLAVAFMDSTLRIYDIETTEEICRFISFDNNEWLCITPDGYYNASPKGDEYINIRFDDEVYGIYQFSRAFYRPEVLKARLQGLPDPDIVKQFGDIMIDNAPPGVTVEVSNEEEATQTGIANLQVSVVDEFKKYPIDHIEIVVNGRLVGADELESVKGENLKTTETRIIPIGKRDSLDFSVSIKLDEGPNDIEIIVANEANYGLDTINLKNNSGNTQNKPDLWLLSIGINDYTNFPANGWNDLNGAAGDAQRIVTSFTEQQGKRYNKVHTLLVADGAEIKTTKSSIMESMEFFKQADPEDVSLLFIAAHGETVNGVYYFIPSDISFDSEGQLEMINAIDTNDIIKSMDIPGRKIILIDTCQSGGVDNNKLIRTLKNRSTVIFSAAQENEYAAENVDFGGGYFTYSILEGINGKASTDDEVLIKQLGDFVNQNVTDIGNQRRYRNKQHPLILIPDGYKDFIIAQIP